jgi:hypothetical protein
MTFELNPHIEAMESEMCIEGAISKVNTVGVWSSRCHLIVSWRTAILST